MINMINDIYNFHYKMYFHKIEISEWHEAKLYF